MKTDILGLHFSMAEFENMPSSKLAAYQSCGYTLEFEDDMRHVHLSAPVSFL
jgi:hypothetical protein